MIKPICDNIRFLQPLNAVDFFPWIQLRTINRTTPFLIFVLR